METIGQRIKRMRLALKLTQKEAVAQIPGMSPSALSQIEIGMTQDVKAENLLGLAKRFGVTVEELITGKPASRYPNLPENAVIIGGRITELPRSAVGLLTRYLDVSETAQDQLRGLAERLHDQEKEKASPSSKARQDLAGPNGR
jgi:transcriptional regulator with XRE-family HTH domain